MCFRRSPVLMFSDLTLDFVGKLHRSGVRCCLITAGAGSTAISALMSVPGCSRTVLDAQVPYSVGSTIELLDYYPQQYVSIGVASALSHAAFARAQKLIACPAHPPTIAPSPADDGGSSGMMMMNMMPGATPSFAAAPSSYSSVDDNNSNNNNNQQQQQQQQKQQKQQHRLSPTPQHSPPPPTRLVGIGATSAISTTYERRGDDRVHACCRTEDGVTFRSLVLTKGMPRHVQEWCVSCVVLQLLADVARVDVNIGDLCLSMINSSSTNSTSVDRSAIVRDLNSNMVRVDRPVGADPFSLLLDGKISKLVFNRHGVPQFDGTRVTPHLPFWDENYSPDVDYLLYPGSFAPLHYGHTELARVAINVVRKFKSSSDRSSRGSRIRQQEEEKNSEFDSATPGDATATTSSSTSARPVVLTFEVATSRVDKSTHTTPTDLARVAAQFSQNNLRVAFTSAKLFIEKAKMFPRHGFVVGVDTAARVVDPKYYNNSKEQMIAALRELEALGCYFVVAGRKWGERGGWTNMSEIATPEEVSHLFVPVPELDFRVDISSTELRARASQQSSPVSQG